MSVVLIVLNSIASYAVLANLTYGWHKAFIIKRDGNFGSVFDRRDTLWAGLIFPFYWLFQTIMLLMIAMESIRNIGSKLHDYLLVKPVIRVAPELVEAEQEVERLLAAREASDFAPSTMQDAYQSYAEQQNHERSCACRFCEPGKEVQGMHIHG